MMVELEDHEIDTIHEAAREAAVGAMAFTSVCNPHPPEHPAHEIWDYAYRNAYARENGR